MTRAPGRHAYERSPACPTWTAAALQMHALAAIAPHVPLAVKQVRANIVKVLCELTTLIAILFFVFQGMADYGALGAHEQRRPTEQEAETLRYAYVCSVSTALAIGHVLLMLLMPESVLARVQLWARTAMVAASSPVRRHAALGRDRQSVDAAGDTRSHAKLKAGHVVPVESAAASVDAVHRSGSAVTDKFDSGQAHAVASGAC